ncbi:ribbon-helix-helix protein, CopG family [Murimonas intestini]|uniref:Ribbon-helix-helix CopG family protein n=1 Tax=Murimonas intestini TaxID=1337051 RepID=A0AB73T7R4_9FIRM|nr:ribbon-helix-helix protein, CopG family [Murimonas intestini]MCR1839660.1 ribbon-helix-helix protein, CopG family [Murimonas intestini]MCR1866503.1 ribbon-helix-helix protein, CopG family [Murimonas intestini]MCR1884873.1 ribbon-helix-helix protein, CopG family [Murimonas intestini]
MKPLKKKLSITIDEDIVIEIRELAEKDDRSVSQYINLVLRGYLNRRNNAIQKKK